MDTETTSITGQATDAAQSGYDSGGARTQGTNPDTNRLVTTAYALARPLS